MTLDSSLVDASVCDVASAPDTFGSRLRGAREARDVSQVAAAKAIGVHAITLCRWETGEHEPRGVVRKVAEAWIARTKKGGRRGA